MQTYTEKDATLPSDLAKNPLPDKSEDQNCPQAV